MHSPITPTFLRTLSVVIAAICYAVCVHADASLFVLIVLPVAALFDVRLVCYVVCFCPVVRSVCCVFFCVCLADSLVAFALLGCGPLSIPQPPRARASTINFPALLRFACIAGLVNSVNQLHSARY